MTCSVLCSVYIGRDYLQIKIHDSSSADPLHYNYGNRNIDIIDNEPNPVNVLLDVRPAHFY